MSSNLNEEQQAAVTATEGYIRVIAGAGTGKTRALTERFAFLVNAMGILPCHILCVTFTNKAAREMKKRIRRLTGDLDTGYINTFHGFCVNVLHEDIHCVQYPKSFLVLDNSDIDAMLSVVYEERGLSLKEMSYADARDMIEMQKLNFKPDYYLDLLALDPKVLKEKYDAAQTVEDIIFYGYLCEEKKCFGLDYNDLIIFTLHIFKTNQEVCSKWQHRLQYIMIDEFQDIDNLQYELMTVLSGCHHNLFIVGDPDQTIYTWRGAKVEYLLDFPEAFPGTKTLMLLTNYRSTSQILDAANNLIDHNKMRIKKDLRSIGRAGPKCVFHLAANKKREAQYIAKIIKDLRNNGSSLKDIAILYRAHHVTRDLEEVFMHEKIPYRIFSGTPFFERKEIKDVLSYLRMAVRGDDMSFKRVINVPKRNIGKIKMKLLENYALSQGCSLYEALKANLNHQALKSTKAAQFVDLIEYLKEVSKSLSVSSLLDIIMDESGYEAMLRTEGAQDRLDNLAELKQGIYEFENDSGEQIDASGYLSYIALYTRSDEEDESDCVKMMTVHAAKGLEFKHVIVCALSEGIFPSSKIAALKQMEEERRLAFVAMTRAQDTLHLTCARGGHYNNNVGYPSRFVLEIDSSLLTYDPMVDEDFWEEAKIYARVSEQKLLGRSVGVPVQDEVYFQAGDRVEHQYLGMGTVLKCDMDKACYIVKFDKLETERAIAFKVNLSRYAAC